MAFCEHLLVLFEKRKRSEVADRPVCQSVPSSLQKQTSLRAIFHPLGIPLVFAVAWLMVVIVQLHFTSWRGSSPKQTNNHAAILLLNFIVSCEASFAFTPRIYSQTREWSESKSVHRIERRSPDYFWRQLSSSEVLEALTAFRVTRDLWLPAKGKRQWEQERVGGMCRVLLIHTTLTYTNRICLRKKKGGNEGRR